MLYIRVYTDLHAMHRTEFHTFRWKSHVFGIIISGQSQFRSIALSNCIASSFACNV